MGINIEIPVACSAEDIIGDVTKLTEGWTLKSLANTIFARGASKNGWTVVLNFGGYYAFLSHSTSGDDESFSFRPLEAGSDPYKNVVFMNESDCDKTAEYIRLQRSRNDVTDAFYYS
ncbi:hypothetical protein EOM86_05665, partial [Candidatus Nomurabacteria bacterium]|nr:hypothetical protein [Candidatus Nomurabacteria bacterium]